MPTKVNAETPRQAMLGTFKDQQGNQGVWSQERF